MATTIFIKWRKIHEHFLTEMKVSTEKNNVHLSFLKGDRVIKKKLMIRMLCTIIIGIVALCSIIIFGFRYYKKAQLNECVSNIQVEEVYAITIRYYYKNKYDLGGITRDPINETIKDEVFINDF